MDRAWPKREKKEPSFYIVVLLHIREKDRSSVGGTTTSKGGVTRGKIDRELEKNASTVGTKGEEIEIRKGAKQKASQA